MLKPAAGEFDNLKAAGQTVVTLKSIAELSAAASAAAPNSRIILPSATNTNTNVVITATGEAGRPVIIEGPESGGAEFTGKFRFTIKGSYVVVRNLNVKNYDSPDYGGGSAVVVFDACNHCALHNSRFDTSIAASMSGPEDLKHFKTVMIKPSSKFVEIARNTFKGKRNGGSVILVNRDSTGIDNHRIVQNLITGRLKAGNNANDFDAIRIGDSANSQTPTPAAAEAYVTNQSVRPLGTTIEFNVFENGALFPDIFASCKASGAWQSTACKGEPEIVSLKAPQSIFRFNSILNYSGGITIRHGFQDIVEGNFVSGKNLAQGITEIAKSSYGIRVIGENHLVISNHIEDVDTDSALTAGISILPGQAGAALSGYWKVSDTIIARNFIRNAVKPIATAADYGGRSKTVLSTGIVIDGLVISGGDKAFVNDATNEAYYDKFLFSRIAYSSAEPGVSAKIGSKVAAIDTKAIGTSGFNEPTLETYVGATGSLSASPAENDKLLSQLSQVSNAAAQERMRKLSKLLLIKNGSVYKNFRPLTRADVGCNF